MFFPSSLNMQSKTKQNKTKRTHYLKHRKNETSIRQSILILFQITWHICSYIVILIPQVEPLRQSLTHGLWLLLHHAIPGGLAFVVWHLGQQEVRKSSQASSLQNRWRTGSLQLTGWLRFCETEMFTEDTWERILWRSQRCAWFISWNFHVNHSSAPGWSFLLCVCVFLLFGRTFAANGTCPAECWLLGSPCFFVNLNEKGRGRRGKKSLQSDPKRQPGEWPGGGRLLESGGGLRLP